MTSTVRWMLAATAVVMAIDGCDTRREVSWRHRGWLVCSRSNAIVALELASGRVDTLRRIGVSGARRAGVSLVGHANVLYSQAPLLGKSEVVVFDAATDRDIGRYDGWQGVSVDSAEMLVRWRAGASGVNELVWNAVAGDSGVLLSAERGHSEQAVVCGAKLLIWAGGDTMVCVDGRSRMRLWVDCSGLRPLCEGRPGEVVCQRGVSDTVVVFSLTTRRVVRSLGVIRGFGWTLDAVNGGVLCSIPARDWWRAKEYDLVSIDLDTGRVQQGISNFWMLGGVVVERRHWWVE